MKTKVLIPYDIHRQLAKILFDEANAQGVSIFHACANKTKAAVAVRGEVIEWIMQNLRVNRDVKPMRIELAAYQPDWPRPTLAIVGYIMDRDHPTIHYARTRWNLARLAEKQAASAQGAPL